MGAGVVLGAAPPLFLGDCGVRSGADTESSPLFFGGNGGFGLGAGALLGAVPPLCLGGDGFGLGVGVTPGSAPPLFLGGGGIGSGADIEASPLLLGGNGGFRLDAGVVLGAAHPFFQGGGGVGLGAGAALGVALPHFLGGCIIGSGVDAAHAGETNTIFLVGSSFELGADASVTASPLCLADGGFGLDTDAARAASPLIGPSQVPLGWTRDSSSSLSLLNFILASERLTILRIGILMKPRSEMKHTRLSITDQFRIDQRVRSKLVGKRREYHVDIRDAIQNHRNANGGGVKLKIDGSSLQ